MVSDHARYFQDEIISGSRSNTDNHIINMITIRKAEEKDRQAFIEMEKEFCKHYRDSGFNKHLKPVKYEDIPESYFVDSFNELLSGDNFFSFAEEDGRAIGYIEAEIDRYPKF